MLKKTFREKDITPKPTVIQSEEVEMTCSSSIYNVPNRQETINKCLHAYYLLLDFV